MKACLTLLFTAFAMTATARQPDKITSILEILDVTNGGRAVVKEFPYRIEAPNRMPDSKRVAFVSYRIE